MSVKRQATTELNHDNWDQEDPKDDEDDAGGFKIASKDVLQKRVIRTAKRRSQISGEEDKKSVFSGFSGFNKTQPLSFDFLSNLTNGKNVTSSTPKSNVPMIFGTNIPKTTASNSGLFSITGAAPKPAESSKDSSPLFSAATSKIGSGSLFSASQDSKPANPFSTQSTSSAFASFSPKTSESVTASQSSTNIFGANTTPKISNSTIPTTTSNSFTTSSISFKTNSSPTLAKTKQDSDNKTNDTEDPKAKYYSKLKSLNVSVSDWIKQHVDKTPLCILSPIFKDYEKYLKDIQDEYERSKGESKSEEAGSVATSSNNTTALTTNASSPFTNNVKSMFSTSPSTFPASDTPNFTFGTNTNSNIATSNSGIFGIKSPPGVDSTPASIPSNGNAPFSFGIGKPFSFNSNIKSSEEPPAKPENVEDEDEPPKVEYTPVAEENSVYDKKCKIFLKKDENFVDKGVGTLYIKKIEESGKHQLLVRANTSLGNVLLNLILSSSLPTKRMGKNNVMMVCIPTPDFKPPPVPILIRVKTSEEADDLLSTLEKYKS